MIDYLVEAFLFTPPRPSKVSKTNWRAKLKPFLTPIYDTKSCWKFWLKMDWIGFAKGQLISKAIYGLLTSPKKWTNEFVFLSWRLGNTWNLNFDFKLQVFPSLHDRETIFFFRFLGEVFARQFWFKIYWPLCEDIQYVT